MKFTESTPPKHDEFEEICASASLGKATAEDLARLERHVLVCPSCWQAYHNYVSAAACEFAAVVQDPKLTAKEAKECLDSELFMQRWFDRAEREGLTFSEEARRPDVLRQRPRSIFSSALLLKQYAMPLAAAVLVVLSLSTGYLYWKSPSNSILRERESESTSRAQIANHAKDLEVTNETLKQDIDRLNRQLADTEAKLSATKANGQKEMEQARKDFASQHDALQAQAIGLQAQLLQGQKELAHLESTAAEQQKEAEEERKRTGELQASLVAKQAELSDTTEKLDDESNALSRDRELLGKSRDITDLMGARNLHILDVVDTDTRGKSRPAFGRIFFTEGKSLLFYAYDLNEAKLQKADYQYQVWAKKEGANGQAEKLGIFYSDDKAQNRWVFKCEDPKVIKEIDSVFVTLGPPNSDPTHPKGLPLMYAYLHTAANHP
jgi:hypothetical protein